MEEMAALGGPSQETTSKPKDDRLVIKLTDADADALREFRKGKPQLKTGKALTEGNGARLKNIVAMHILENFHGIESVTNKFLLVCEAVAEVKDNDGNVIHPAKPSAEAKVSIKPDSYCSHHGLSKSAYERIKLITDDPLLEKGEQFTDRHFTMAVNPVIKFGSVPPALRKEVLSAITRLKNLRLEIKTDEGTKVVEMPEDAIQIVPKYFPKSTFHDARRTELDQVINKRLEEEGIATGGMIT